MSRQKTTLIKNGMVVTDNDTTRTDILIQGEKIVQWGDFSTLKADAEVDAHGLLVLPGAVDTHVHFNDEFMGTVSVHDYYTGTLAAAFGGVTSIVDFSNQHGREPLINTVLRKKEEARNKALIDWGVHPVITTPSDTVLKDIPRIVAAGAPTVKCYMTYRREGLMVTDSDLESISREIARSNGMLLVHAEDNDIIEKNISALIQNNQTSPLYHARSRPPAAEENAIRRIINIARTCKCRIFIVHLAADKGLDMVAAARREGVDIFAETCTHYLVFTEDALLREDGVKWICSPPLRSKAIQDTLWQGLNDGRIAMVSSDDAAYSWEAKLLGKERFDRCPNGIPGVEVRLPLLYSEGVAKGRISLQRLVELVSTAPAKLFGMAGQKGSLLPGFDADIVLFDPQKQWIMRRETLHMATDWSAYENIPVTGKIEQVFSRGECIIDGDHCLAERGRGRFIMRKLY